MISDANDNKRVNPDTGAAIQDGAIQFAAGDRNAGRDPNDIESNRDVLVTQNPPNNGTLNTVGSLGVNTSDVVGFDIRRGGGGGSSRGYGSGYGGSGSGDYTAYAALRLEGRTQSGLYRIDLGSGSGRASFVGTIGGPAPLESLAILDYNT